MKKLSIKQIDAMTDIALQQPQIMEKPAKRPYLRVLSGAIAACLILAVGLSLQSPPATEVTLENITMADLDDMLFFDTVEVLSN